MVILSSSYQIHIQSKYIMKSHAHSMHQVSYMYVLIWLLLGNGIFLRYSPDSYTITTMNMMAIYRWMIHIKTYVKSLKIRKFQLLKHVEQITQNDCKYCTSSKIIQNPVKKSTQFFCSDIQISISFKMVPGL